MKKECYYCRHINLKDYYCRKRDSTVFHDHCCEYWEPEYFLQPATTSWIKGLPDSSDKNEGNFYLFVTEQYACPVLVLIESGRFRVVQLYEDRAVYITALSKVLYHCEIVFMDFLDKNDTPLCKYTFRGVK